MPLLLRLAPLLALACRPSGEPPPSPADPAPSGETAEPAETGETGETGETADSSADPALRVVTAADWLNLRDQPSGQGAVLRALPCGAEITLLGGAEGNWVSARGEGVEGWVHGRYLALPDELPPDLCPGPAPYGGEPPGALVNTLDVTPYVEQSCTDTQAAGWPFEARRCRYNNGLQVTVANPSAALVAFWITDAAQLIPALAALEERDRGAWKRGLDAIAWHTLYQSSRIFPIEGEVDEGYVYDFDRGVTVGCSTGCYCRINSTTRQQWCAYADELLGIVSESDCLAEVSTSTWTEAWADHCLDNHRAAWTGINHHYRAMAWWANKTVSASFPDPARADPDQVVALIEALY